MEYTAAPVRRTGKRNIDCPFYRGCLDHAVYQNWNSWSCSHCRNQSLYDPAYSIDNFTEFSSEHGGVPNSIMRMIERW